MKIYIDKFNYKMINLNNIKPYFIKKTKFQEIYSSEGIFRIENDNYLSKLNIIDNNINLIKNYIDNISIIVDYSIIKKDTNSVSHLPFDHIMIDTFIHTFTLRPNSPLILNIEFDNDNNIKNLYFCMGAKFKAYSFADIENFSIKEDFETFINLLKSRK
tara:strand:- start:213 stop:689 length:477 start_codon:yes stop_codon:yes gene_type:complete